MAAWLDTWKYRHKITIDSSKIDTSNLTHFPVTVFLNSSAGSGDNDVSDIFDELGSNDNRKKIAFTASDGVTQLYAEIEKWDDANEQAIIHVSKTGWVLNYDKDTDFYIYFDSSQSDNTDYVGDIGSTAGEKVWDSNFKMVQHMVDDDTSHIKDSTSNSNDGTKKAANEPIEVDAKIGKGQSFNSNYIDIGPASNYNWTNQITLSCWYQIVDKTTSRMIIDGWNADGTAGWHIAVHSSGVTRFDIYRGGIQQVDDTTPDAGWHLITGTYNGSSIRLYFDGIEVGTPITTSGAFTAPNDAMTLGCYTYSGTTRGWYIDGDLDEVQISNIGRAANWIKASYNSGNDTLIKDYGDRESFMVDNAILFSCNF